MHRILTKYEIETWYFDTNKKRHQIGNESVHRTSKRISISTTAAGILIWAMRFESGSHFEIGWHSSSFDLITKPLNWKVKVTLVWNSLFSGVHSMQPYAFPNSTCVHSCCMCPGQKKKTKLKECWFLFDAHKIPIPNDFMMGFCVFFQRLAERKKKYLASCWYDRMKK